MTEAEQSVDSALAIARARWAKEAAEKVNAPASTPKVILTPKARAIIDKALPPQPKNGIEAVKILRSGAPIRLPTNRVFDFFRWIDKHKHSNGGLRCRCDQQGEITILTPAT